MDALEVLQFDIIKPDMVVADVGTGGGWPLLALAQSYPDTQFVGIDGRRKKMEAVQTIAIESWLNNVETQRSRIEQVRWSYDIVTARAVAYADVLLEWIHPILKPWGYMILYKLDTEEENMIIRRWCERNRYDVHIQHPYQLNDDKQGLRSTKQETKRILRILKKHRSHEQSKKRKSK